MDTIIGGAGTDGIQFAAGTAWTIAAADLTGISGIETIDFIEAKNLGYHLGNVVKYISRADHKDAKLENLKKAQWYLNRAVAKLKKS